MPGLPDVSRRRTFQYCWCNIIYGPDALPVTQPRQVPQRYWHRTLQHTQYICRCLSVAVKVQYYRTWYACLWQNCHILYVLFLRKMLSKLRGWCYGKPSLYLPMTTVLLVRLNLLLCPAPDRRGHKAMMLSVCRVHRA